MNKILQLRCNGGTGELGITKPVFSWGLESDERFVRQKRFQLQVALDEAFTEVIWNYQKYTDDMQFVKYMGPGLESMTRYYVRVRVWTDDVTATEWSEPIWFETPLLEKEEWKAQWIRPECVEYHGKKQCRRPFCAEKKFCLRESVKRVRLYITSLGVYDVYMNGERVNSDYFRPGFTDYNYSVQYQSYDVTGFIKTENTIDVNISEGWFSGYLGWRGRKDTYGNYNALIAQLEVWYENGERDTICTDGTWVQKFGRRLYSDFYNGEFYDAREEERICGKMLTFAYPKNTLVPQEGPSVKKIMEVKPERIFRDNNGDMILDIGQNMVGWIRFKNTHCVDDTIVLTHGEVLDKEGNFFNTNLRTADAEDTFILEKNDGKLYEPQFTFHGFRYVKLKGFSEDVPLENFTGIVLASEMETTGEFVTGNERINRLQSNILWGQRGNFVDIPTDCPQRDERQGWTADAHIFLPTAAFNMEVNRFFRKWLRDLADGQSEMNGAVPFVVPDILKGMFSEGRAYTTAGWGDAAVICPWKLYEIYGDREILEQQYDSMRAWVEYVRKMGSSEYLWDKDLQLGDWLGLDAREGSYYGATDGALCATAFYAYSAELLAKTANVLGKMHDFKEYTELSGNIKAAFRKRFMPDGVQILSNTQTAHVLVLKFHLAEPEKEGQIAANLVKMLHQNNDHLLTGFLGTPYLCQVLSEQGYDDMAYTLLFHNDFPSWLYQVDQGATTMWEHWDSQKPDGSFWSNEMNSFNHYAYGSIGEWMYKYIGGVWPKKPGYKKAVIAPKPEKRIGSCRCFIRTSYGITGCEWKLDGRRLKLTVKIPANTNAFVILPEPEDRKALILEVKCVTDDHAVYTEGKVPLIVEEYRGGDPYEETPDREETEVKVPEGAVGFELGSGEFMFEYILKEEV